MHLTNNAGNKEAWPLYMSTGATQYSRHSKGPICPSMPENNHGSSNNSWGGWG